MFSFSCIRSPNSLFLSLSLFFPVCARHLCWIWRSTPHHWPPRVWRRTPSSRAWRLRLSRRKRSVSNWRVSSRRWERRLMCEPLRSECQQVRIETVFWWCKVSRSFHHIFDICLEYGIALIAVMNKEIFYVNIARIHKTHAVNNPANPLLRFQTMWDTGFVKLQCFRVSISPHVDTRYRITLELSNTTWVPSPPPINHILRILHIFLLTCHLYYGIRL